MMYYLIIVVTSLLRRIAVQTEYSKHVKARAGWKICSEIFLFHCKLMFFQNFTVLEISLTKFWSREIPHFHSGISDKNVYPVILYAGSSQDFLQSATPFKGESVSICGRRIEGLSTLKGNLCPDSSPVITKFRFQSIT